MYVTIKDSIDLVWYVFIKGSKCNPYLSHSVVRLFPYDLVATSSSSRNNFLLLPCTFLIHANSFPFSCIVVPNIIVCHSGGKLFTAL
jgi:hypothetical protein